MERFVKLRIYAFAVSALTLTACSSVTITNYIKDENPYKKAFGRNFNQLLEASTRALMDSGWTIAETTDPAIFERQRVIDDENIKQLLLVTEIRHTALILGSRYARVNIFLKTISENSTEVEIRYFSVTTIPFKSFQSFKKDKIVNKLFTKIESNL